jgi:hypothetical protein
MNLLQISRVERDTSPVFIVGEARSGSTILLRTLQKHPAFRPALENLMESKLMNHVEKSAVFGPREPKTAYAFMADDTYYQAFLASIAPLRPLLRIGEATLWRMRPGRRRDQVWAATGHPLVVRSYFHHARKGLGVTRIVDKSPNQVRQVDRILRCYPQARLIYIHRHPVDVYSSYVRLGQVDSRFQWARIPLAEFTRRWANRSRLALRTAARLPASFLLLRYEDFTEDPEKEVRRTCDFVCEEFDPEMVVERKPDLTRRKATPHLFGEITTKTKDWTDYVSAEEAATLQKRLRPIMQEMSYEDYQT